MEKQAEVGVAGANALGQMGANGAGNVNLGGGGDGGDGFNMAAMMASMAVGGAVSQNIAGAMNNMMGGDGVGLNEMFDGIFDDDDENPLEAVANAMDAASNDDGSDKKEE